MLPEPTSGHSELRQLSFFTSRGPCRQKNCASRNQAQTLPRRGVRGGPPTLDCGSTSYLPFNIKVGVFTRVASRCRRSTSACRLLGSRLCIDATERRIRRRFYDVDNRLAMWSRDERVRTDRGEASRVFKPKKEREASRASLRESR